MNLLQKNEDGYCFAHDKIKEALEKLLTDDEAHGIHSRLVEFFLADEHRTKKNIFILLFHYGVFAHTITCRAKRRQMVRLYLGAGKKARNQSAFALALKYFALGKAHFPGDIWAQDYDLALEFCRHMAECSYRASDFAMAHEIFKETGTRARSFSHCLAVEMVKIPCYHAQGKGKEALEAGLGILRHLGIKIKKKPSSPGIIFAVLRVWARFVLSRKSRLIKKQMVPGTDIYLPLNASTPWGPSPTICLLKNSCPWWPRPGSASP